MLPFADVRVGRPPRRCCVRDRFRPRLLARKGCVRAAVLSSHARRDRGSLETGEIAASLGPSERETTGVSRRYLTQPHQLLSYFLSPFVLSFPRHQLSAPALASIGYDCGPSPQHTLSQTHQSRLLFTLRRLRSIPSLKQAWPHHPPRHPRARRSTSSSSTMMAAQVQPRRISSPSTVLS